MVEDDLKNFLRQQARSLDSLLELTPAKNMFGEDVSDQWKRKKQTPEQKRAARIAKLDPANWKSAKDVYDERSIAAAKKRKRGEEGLRQPMLNKTTIADIPQNAQDETKPSKKRKIDEEVSRDLSERSNHDRPRDPNSDKLDNPNARKRAKKRANRLEKKRVKEEHKAQAKSQKKLNVQSQPGSATREEVKSTPMSRKGRKIPGGVSHQELGSAVSRQNLPPTSNAQNKQWKDLNDDKISQESVSEGEAEEQIPESEIDDNSSSAPSTSEVSDVLSPPQESASSSVSSIPPNILEGLESATKTLLPLPKDSRGQKAAEPVPKTLQSEKSRQAARERLQQQISRFRSQRKADEKPIRSRAELLEQRREEEQKRRMAKKEQKRKEKEEEARRQDEEMAKRFSPGGSGSLLGSPRSPMIDYGDNGGFSFGRIAFGDGTQLDPSTMAAAENRKHKGPSDPASALKAAQSKAARLSGLDEQKRQDIDEKDMWLNAKKRAHGERTKDDTSLLKKALKRQDKEKGRSEKDWSKRIEGVRAAQEAKQKKRTENLQKRKDEKFAKKPGKKSKIKRPGFEGSFRGRTSSKKK